MIAENYGKLQFDGCICRSLIEIHIGSTEDLVRPLLANVRKQIFNRTIESRKMSHIFCDFLFRLIDGNETISIGGASSKMQTPARWLIYVYFNSEDRFFPHFELDTANERSQFDFMANTWNYDRFTFGWF